MIATSKVANRRHTSETPFRTSPRARSRHGSRGPRQPSLPDGDERKVPVRLLRFRSGEDQLPAIRAAILADLAR